MTQVLSEREVGAVAGLPGDLAVVVSPSGPAPVRIYVVDAHPVVAEGLARIVSVRGVGEVVGVATSGKQALRELTAGPDLVIVAHHLAGDLTGPELCRALSRDPYRLVCLGMCDGLNVATAQHFLAAGASGVLLKSSSGDAVQEAVVAVASGKPYLDPLLLDPMGGASDRLAQGEPLTATEHKILHAVAEGASNKEIAATLGVSANAVKGHVSHVLHKLGVRTRTEAVAVAVRRRLVALAPDNGRGP